VGEDACDHRLILTVGRDDLTARNTVSKTSIQIIKTLESRSRRILA
jgi:hypothetical protein